MSLERLLNFELNGSASSKNAETILHIGRGEAKFYVFLFLPVLMASAFFFGRWFPPGPVHITKTVTTPAHIGNSSSAADVERAFQGKPIGTQADKNCPVPVKVYGDKKSWYATLCKP